MKTIIALFLVLFSISFAQSSFAPDWKNCGGLVGWKTNNITLDAAPVAGQNSTFHICGTNKDLYAILFRDIRATSGDVLNVTFNNDTTVNWGASECFDLTLQIPQGTPQQIFVRFDLIGTVPREIGCANVTLNLANGTKYFRHHHFSSNEI